LHDFTIFLDLKGHGREEKKKPLQLFAGKLHHYMKTERLRFGETENKPVHSFL
jgi:hypothetical protein